jgi:hypothetical protein
MVTDPVMTEASQVNNIWGVSSRTAQMFTKRRAVDFCLVATAICCAALSADA